MINIYIFVIDLEPLHLTLTLAKGIQHDASQCWTNVPSNIAIMNFTSNTPPHDVRHSCQVILKSSIACRSYAMEQYFPLISQCELDLWPTRAVHSRDTMSYSGEHLFLSNTMHAHHILQTMLLHLIITGDLELPYIDLNHAGKIQLHERSHFLILSDLKLWPPWPVSYRFKFCAWHNISQWGTFVLSYMYITISQCLQAFSNDF